MNRKLKRLQYSCEHNKIEYVIYRNNRKSLKCLDCEASISVEEAKFILGHRYGRIGMKPVWAEMLKRKEKLKYEG